MSGFRTTRRIEFGDTDMAGIVHFANFFRFMESAETEFLRSRGLTVSWRDAEGSFGFPRVSASCDFKSPARFEDVLDIAVTVEKVGRRSVAYRFDFSLAEVPVAVGRITTVFCKHSQGAGLESIDIPDRIRGLLEDR